MKQLKPRTLRIMSITANVLMNPMAFAFGFMVTRLFTKKGLLYTYIVERSSDFTYTAITLSFLVVSISLLVVMVLTDKARREQIADGLAEKEKEWKRRIMQ